ncbi:antitoxin [Acinetobacter baumannii]|nr:antitoxin [Acinetobacter baumannii]WEH90786.1 antitoxin [Acinetobacter soli]
MNTAFDPIVSEFDSSDHESEYNAWFKAKIEKSMADTRPTVPHDQVVARLKKRREERTTNVNR